MAHTFDEGSGVVHRFDTERRDLELGGYLLELRARMGRLFVVVSKQAGNAPVDAPKPNVDAQIDGAWALEIPVADHSTSILPRLIQGR